MARPRPTSLAPAVRARSTTADRRFSESAHPSQRYLGLLTRQCRALGVTLPFTCLGNQFPQVRLKGWTATGKGQPATSELLGLGGIALSHPHLRQTVKHLRLTRSNTLGALEAGGGTIEITARLLLLSGGQQRQYRAIQLLVGRQPARTG